uniref:Uncharacterized protein n=1 Tax=Calcidiscus leptoporus TaxID=127549 RepID=A0A7S0IM07_9EUKA|mmetsp:Transcript_12903/g.29705  ORF Transcript_12903/g.29705 Transcript_12903/m.29705 type:complete len:126 (+) Transcript_12903:3-380(+)
MAGPAERAREKGGGGTVPPPFRLTRELRDGLGVGGVEGLFAKTAERALRAFRSDEARAAVLTLLDGLLLEEVGGARSQLQLLRAEERLAEVGSDDVLTGDVHHLIADATDEAQLMHMPPQWTPWL